MGQIDPVALATGTPVASASAPAARKTVGQTTPPGPAPVQRTTPKKAAEATQRSVQTYQDIASDDAAFESFATALTGKTADQRTAEENAALDQLRQDMLNGTIAPDVVVTGGGDDALPEGTYGAYVPGENGAPGTIILSGTLDSETRQVTADEEYGEAIADRARALGVPVADGDAGERARRSAAGETITTDTRPDLFTAAPEDDVTVVLDGEEATASAYADYVAPDLEALETYGFFAGYDADGDGYLSQDEMTNALIAFGGSGHNIQEKRIKILMRLYGVRIGDQFFVPLTDIPGQGRGLPDLARNGVIARVDGGIVIDFSRVSANTLAYAFLEHVARQRSDKEGREVTIAEVEATGITNAEFDEATDNDDFINDWKAIRSDSSDALVHRFGSRKGGSDTFTLNAAELTHIFGRGAVVVTADKLNEGFMPIKYNGDVEPDLTDPAALYTYMMAYDADNNGILDESEIVAALARVPAHGANTSGERVKRLLMLYGFYDAGLKAWVMPPAGLDNAIADGTLAFATDVGQTETPTSAGLRIDFGRVPHEVWALAVLHYIATKRGVPPHEVTSITAAELETAIDDMTDDHNPVTDKIAHDFVQTFGTRVGSQLELTYDNLLAIFYSGGVYFHSVPNKDFIPISVFPDVLPDLTNPDALTACIFRYDANGDGFLDEAEFRQAIANLGGTQLTNDQVHRIFMLYGGKRDGTQVIAISGFHEAMQDSVLRFDGASRQFTLDLTMVTPGRIARAAFQYTADQRGIPVQDLDYITAAEFDMVTDHVIGDWKPVRTWNTNILANKFGTRDTGYSEPILSRSQVQNMFDSGPVTMHPDATRAFIPITVDVNATPNSLPPVEGPPGDFLDTFDPVTGNVYDVQDHTGDDPVPGDAFGEGHTDLEHTNGWFTTDTVSVPTEVLEPIASQPGVYEPPQITSGGTLFGVSTRAATPEEMSRTSYPDGRVTWTIGNNVIETRDGSKLDQYLSAYQNRGDPGANPRPNATLVESYTDPVTGDLVEVWAPATYQFETAPDGTPTPPVTEPFVTVNRVATPQLRVFFGVSALDGSMVFGIEVANPTHDPANPASPATRTYFLDVEESPDADVQRPLMGLFQTARENGTLVTLETLLADPSDPAAIAYAAFETHQFDTEHAGEAEELTADAGTTLEEVTATPEGQAYVNDATGDLLETGVMVDAATMEALGLIPPGETDTNQIYFLPKTEELQAAFTELGLGDINDDILHVLPPGSSGRGLKAVVSGVAGEVLFPPQVTYIDDHQWESTGTDSAGRTDTRRFNLRARWATMPIAALNLPISITGGFVIFEGTSNNGGQVRAAVLKARSAASIVLSVRYGRITDWGGGRETYPMIEADVGYSLSGRAFFAPLGDGYGKDSAPSGRLCADTVCQRGVPIPRLYQDDRGQHVGKYWRLGPFL